MGIYRSELSRLLKQDSREEIACKYGVASRTLDRIIRQQGLQRKNYGRKHVDAAEIRSLYMTGEFTQTELAMQFGVSQPLISKIVNKQLHRRSLCFGGSAIVSSSVG